MVRRQRRRALVLTAAVAGGWACGTSSAGRETILFGSDRDAPPSIRALGGDGSGPLKTVVRGTDGAFAWSAAAERIAFARSTALHVDLLTTRHDGSEESVVSRFEGESVGALAWSADGTRFAVITTSRSDSETSTLWVLDANGENKRSVRHRPRLGRPSWSPDARTLAVTEFSPPMPAARLQSFAVLLIDVDGSSEPMRIDASPSASWSPDGKSLALVFPDAEFENVTVRVRARDGTEEVQVADHVRDFPVWSNDSSHLALIRTGIEPRPNISALYVVARDGSGLRRLSEVPDDAGCIEWSPDDDRIAYLSESGLTVLGMDGEGRRTFADTTDPLCPVEWISTPG